MSRRSPKPNSVENSMVRSLDRLARYEAFEESIAPLLRQAIEEGWTPEQMRSHPKIRAMMAARQITIAISDPDASKALAAIKDSTDRLEGKPVERAEIEHKYAKLKEDELDSLILSTLGADPEEPAN